jgi:hypothetical protein
VVRPVKKESDGSLDHALVERALNRVTAKLSYCLESPDAAAGTHVVVTFAVTSSGAVVQVAAKTATAEQLECLRSSLAAASFPRSDGITTATIDFEYYKRGY